MQYVDSSLHKQQCIIGLATVDHISTVHFVKFIYMLYAYKLSWIWDMHTPYKLIECF